MRDRSKQLLVINTGKKQSEQTGMTSQSGTTHIIGGGGLSVNMSDYLLKSIWDKVFEIRTDSQGTEYIFGKLPMVTQYGITMYSGDGVNVPSLASGLPFDGRTIWYNPDTQQIEVIGGTGGGSGEGVSNFWDLSGIPSWITNSKPKYSYSEIEGTPDLTKYALASQIPSLSGYATESWVLQKNYATKATTLSGYGITDAYTKTNVDDLLKSYVTLGGRQTITGEKNFTGGLKVNGSPIYYDTEKKYWKLEGDLLVTGGVTMYGSDSSFTPSTIMDALLYDDATLGINSNGQLYVKGGTSGGGLDITALQNYLTSNSYLNITEGDGRYLKLSGGTLTGALGINTSVENSGLSISYNGTPMGSLCTNGSTFEMFNTEGYGITTLGTNLYALVGWNKYTLWHSGNDGSGSGLDADLLDGKHLSDIIRYEGLNNNGNNAASAQTITYWGEGNWGHGSTYGTSLNIQGAGLWNNRIDFRTDGILDYYQGINMGTMTHIGTIAFTSSNVASATKLQTAKTIWGQGFDGTGNVSGVLSGVDGITFNSYNAVSVDYNSNFVFKQPNTTALQDWSIQKNDTTKIFIVRNDGNVGIGFVQPSHKLEVNGDGYFSSNLTVGGGITMYSDQRKKTILNHVELSLKQIAEAPLIEHYYNSDDKKTTHVGSIAQYWAKMNDWFCKLDSEGYYTMEIQNAALASAISIARELDRYETNTDKAIKNLKKRICELEEEVERLKSA